VLENELVVVLGIDRVSSAKEEDPKDNKIISDVRFKNFIINNLSRVAI